MRLYSTSKPVNSDSYVFESKGANTQRNINPFNKIKNFDSANRKNS